MMRLVVAALIGAALAAAALGREPDFREFRAVQESLHRAKAVVARRNVSMKRRLSDSLLPLVAAALLIPQFGTEYGPLRTGGTS